jgi:3-keto-L-gulonate-6-phosphate decarboxylase
METKLQLAIDTLTPQGALLLVEQVNPYIDIIEAGTPFIKRFGLEVLTRFRQVAPDKLLVADTRTWNKRIDQNNENNSLRYMAASLLLAQLMSSFSLIKEQFTQAHQRKEHTHDQARIALRSLRALSAGDHRLRPLCQLMSSFS